MKMKGEYRVLDLPERNALYNTALDQLLLEEAAQGRFTIAFTSWLPSILIGNSQSLALDVDMAKCREKGISVMRRFSGGQAVYLDKNYIVFTVAGPRSCFPEDLTKLRQQLCEVVVSGLNRLGVAAVFYEPDNVVIPYKQVKTIGNSAQIIKKDAVAIEASVRYELPVYSLRDMLAVLKINGQSLSRFFTPCRDALAWVRQFTKASRSEVKEALLKEIVHAYRLDRLAVDSDVNQAENVRIDEIVEEMILRTRLEDKPSYVSRGVCYFYLNGKCIVPELRGLLPFSRPSTVSDSTII